MSFVKDARDTSAPEPPRRHLIAEECLGGFLDGCSCACGVFSRSIGHLKIGWRGVLPEVSGRPARSGADPQQSSWAKLEQNSHHEWELGTVEQRVGERFFRLSKLPNRDRKGLCHDHRFIWL